MLEKLPALYGALAVAQGQFLPIAKNRSVTIKPRDGAAYSFRFADLEAIITGTRQALSSNGLAIVQLVEPNCGTEYEPGKRYDQLVTKLLHKDGAHIEDRVDLPSPSAYGDPKQYAGDRTYLRRYARSSLLDVAADDDLDDNGQGIGDTERGFNTREGTAQGQAPAPAATKTSAVARALKADEAPRLTTQVMDGYRAQIDAATSSADVLNLWKEIGPHLANSDDHTEIGKAISTRNRALKASPQRAKENA